MPSGAVKEGRTQAQQMRDLLQMFMDYAGLYNQPAGAELVQFLSGSGFTNFNELLGALDRFRGDVDRQYSGRRGATPSYPPELQALLTQLGGLTERAGELTQTAGRTARTDYTNDRLQDILTYGNPRVVQDANGILDRGGYSPGMAELFDRVRELTAFGGMTAPLAASQQVGVDMIGRQGRTPESEAALSTFLKGIQSGGRDSGTSALFSQGQQIATNGGWTPQMQGLLSQINQYMATGGMTPESTQLFNKAMSIVNANGEGGALLPQDQMISMSRDAVNTAIRQKAEDARRQFVQQTGGAVASGIAGNTLASFADEAAQAEAGAVRDTIAMRQKQQMEQLLASMGVAGDVSKTASGLLGQLGLAGGDLSRAASQNIATGAGLMSDSEKVAADRFRTAAGGFSDVSGQELARLNSGINLLLGTQNAANARMGIGMDTGGRLETVAASQQINALQSLLQNSGLQLNAGDIMTRLFGAETGRELGGYDALRGLLGMTQSTSFGQQGLDLQALDSQLRNTLTSLGISGDMANSIAGSWLNAINGLSGIGSQYSGLVPSATSGLSNLSSMLVQAAMQPSIWSQLLNTAVGGAVGGLTGGLGGALAGGLTNGAPRSPATNNGATDYIRWTSGGR
jgi:hypothetical protein